ncbi:hypothetical protein II906_12220 [bacterium]|nr:hypothetical protein [bacterium]
MRDITYGEFCGPKVEGETQVVRNPVTANGELRQVMHLGINTMWEAFEYNLKVGRNKKDFVGYRKRKNQNELEDKYTWVTYEEGEKKILNFCRGLNVLNLCPNIQIENDELKSDKIISLKKYIKDYTDTAALLKNIDILVTADSSIAHAAGALGIKTYLMLPKIPEWRWFNDDKNTPWYKSIKIFKENDKTGWAGVISRISREITKYANK